MINEIYNLALKVYKPEEVSPLLLYQKMYEMHPETFIVEKNEDGKVIGYIIVCYLDNDDFNKTIKEEFTESVLDFSKQDYKTENLYFFSIVVDFDSHKNKAFKLIKKFKSFIENHKINNVSALIYSKEGEKLCRLIGMANPYPNIFVYKK